MMKRKREEQSLKLGSVEHDIGDEVFLIYDNRIVKGNISEIKLTSIRVRYDVRIPVDETTSYSNSPDEIFVTFDELVQAQASEL